MPPIFKKTHNHL